MNTSKRLLAMYSLTHICANCANGSGSDSNDSSGERLKDIKRGNDVGQFSSAHLHNVFFHTLAPLSALGHRQTEEQAN